MRKILTVVLSLVVLLCFACFFACGGNNAENEKGNENEMVFTLNDEGTAYSLTEYNGKGGTVNI